VSPIEPANAPAAPAREGLHLELVAIDWVRIQVIFRLRPSRALAESERISVWLARQRADGGAAPNAGTGGRMPPTRAWREGNDLVARFNVMQGPGQVPLEAGTWHLAASARDLVTGRAHAVDVHDPNQLAVTSAPAAFRTPAGVYGVRTAHQPGRGLAMRIRLDRRAASAVGPGRRAHAGWAWRLARLLGRPIFRLGVSIVRRLTAGYRPAILFTSTTRPNLGGNLAAVHDRMVDRGDLRDVEVLFSFPSPGRWHVRDRLKLPWMLARADVIVVDDFHPIASLLDGRRSWIVQLWHASGVVKTILYSRIGKPDGPDPWSQQYKNFRYAIVASDGDVAHFAEAFGIPEARVIPTGIPRMDRFFDERARVTGREAALAAHPSARGRFVILFAPTFRGVGATRSYDVNVLDYAALHALCVEKDAVFVVRLHPRLRHELRIPPELRDRILDGSDVATDAPDILFATDLLITDYSSIIFEFATLNRPMLFFAPDLETYREEVDFYEPYESLVPGRIVRTMDELVDAIRREDYGADRLPAFIERHIAHLDSNATDRVIDQLILPGLQGRRA
jgi:CDP-glycerol glycerophosphotransferase (TagB/SpsB family)